MAVADKIRQMSSAKELERVAEDVLPPFEKFLESPEEKRLRRIRSGVITAAIGLAATMVTLLVALDKSDFFPFVMPAVVTFFIGLGIITTGLVFTVPRKKLPGDASDAFTQKDLDSGVKRNRYEAPAVPTSFTNELDPKLQNTSVTEHTTHHLGNRKT
jgi:hypothetical protein